MGKHKGTQEFLAANESLGAEGASFPVAEVSGEGHVEVDDGSLETAGRTVRTFTADEAYRRIANILKRTPRESRANVLAAATAVVALG
jgi:hypothetical protein